MEGRQFEELTIDEAKYQIWKKELEEKREARKSVTQDHADKPRTPRIPQNFIEDAARRRTEARTAVHVEAQATTDIFQRIDEMLEAS